MAIRFVYNSTKKYKFFCQQKNKNKTYMVSQNGKIWKIDRCQWRSQVDEWFKNKNPPISCAVYSYSFSYWKGTTGVARWMTY